MSRLMPDGTPPAPLNLSWLTESLAVGGCFAVDSVERLAREHAITHVVDLREEACDEELALSRHGIRLLHLPTPDMCAVSAVMLAKGVGWLRRELQPGRRALVHCQHGIGRSALLAMCALVDGGMAPLAAMALAKDARAVVSPSPEQLRAFLTFAGQSRRARQNSWPIPTFEALATIAYRHLRLPGGDPQPPGKVP